MNRVFFVGPLPPPVHGFSWINSQVFNLIQKKCHILHFDRNPSSSGLTFTLLKSISRIISFAFKLLTARPSMVYVAWSGGKSMMIDFIYILLSRLFVVPVCLHHHSFAYLNNVKWYNRLALRPTRKQHHVALCRTMAETLSTKYDIEPNSLIVVSNAAFLPPSELPPITFKQSIVVGFLSNVTEAKGIYEFFDLANFFANDRRFHFNIAGPIDPSIHEHFNSRLSKSCNITYKGAVYSDEKTQFFNALDVFVFPTKYENEAEPVTISEALRFGLPVISIQRGCISSMLGSTGVLTSPEDFLSNATCYLTKMVSDQSFYHNERLLAVERFDNLRAESLDNLESLVKHLSGQTS